MRLNVEALEDRTTPSTFTVKLLSAPAGVPGDTAATVSGSIDYRPVLAVNEFGQVSVTADSPLHAVRLAFDGSVQVTSGGQSWTYSPLINGDDSSIGGLQSDHKPFWFDGSALWLEDMAALGNLSWTTPGGGSGSGGGGCDWDYNDHKWFVEVQEVTTDYPVPGDLDILDSNGDEVAESKETAVGGWVSLNNDNDNYDFYPSAGLSHTVDSDNNSKTDGENDLVPLKVTLGEPLGSYYFIDLSQASDLRFWTTPDKETQYTGGTIDMTGKQSLTVWAEGVVASSKPRLNLVQLKFRGANQAIHTVDQVRLTVYRVEGAMNVPGYSKHTYAAEVPDATPRFAAGNMATNVTAGNAVANPNSPIKKVTAQVLWGAGAEVGVYRVYPTADNNFWIDRQVNVVKITFTAAEGAGTNQLVYENHPDTAPTPDLADPLRRYIASSRTFTPPPPDAPPGTPPKLIPAMSAKLKVSTIEGPTVNGAMRGVKFVEIGFVQSSTNTNQHAEFKTAPEVTRRYRYVLEGKTYRDGKLASSVWYEPTPSTERVGVYSSATDPAAAISNIDLFIDDTPTVPVTDKVLIPYGGFEYLATWFRLVNDFQLFFSARTKETSLGSEAIYTQRGKATWHFNGSGEITWTPVPGGAVHKWNKGADSKNDGDKFFSEMTDGSVVPVTIGDTANDADYAAMNSTTTAPWSVR